MAGSESGCGSEPEGAQGAAPGAETHPKPIRFIVIIRGRNCAKYVDKCLRSLRNQVYQNWQAVVVLDQPEDNSNLIVNQHIYEDKRIDMHVNTQRFGLCHNMYWAIEIGKNKFNPDDDTVFAILDADDWLSKKALLRHKKVFEKKPKIMITHGSYIKLSIGRKTKISRPYPKHGKVRKLPWRGSHFKCIKWSVLKNIKEDWFKHKGEWLDAASDLALMFPCIELAGLKRVRHVPQAVYYWRDSTPSKTGRSAQIRCEKVLRHMPRLKQLGDL